MARLSEDSEPAAFSSVALTLISIIIALGIEHLLGHISERLPTADTQTRILIAAQSAATFLTICAIWITYATQLMTAAWKPQFQDFYVPLLILCLLYFWISTIGDASPWWLYLSSVGSGIALYGNRFGLPETVARRMVPGSAAARPHLLTVVSLFLAGVGGGVATHVGALSVPKGTILISLMAVGQLVGAWFQFRWWRSA